MVAGRIVALLVKALFVILAQSHLAQISLMPTHALAKYDHDSLPRNMAK